MAKNLQSNIHVKNQAAAVSVGKLGPDELKNLVRDGLVGMNIAEREAFFRALESEVRLLGLDVTKYLVPLGIPGRSADDLTPTEVGHLVRYLKINAPGTVPAIEKAISRFAAFADKLGRPGKLAA